jgi:uncharacterized alkaline shock family protein YloU
MIFDIKMSPELFLKRVKRMDDRFIKSSELMEMDAKEVDLPETTYIRDIESRVFQGIVLQCLAKIKGIGLIGGNLIDSLLGRETERIKGIFVEQDQKKHSVFIRVEVNVIYGVKIPEKAEEIQNKIIEEITTYTGLHVSSVHVIFKSLITGGEEKNPILDKKNLGSSIEEYGQGF